MVNQIEEEYDIFNYALQLLVLIIEGITIPSSL